MPEGQPLVRFNGCRLGFERDLLFDQSEFSPVERHDFSQRFHAFAELSRAPKLNAVEGARIVCDGIEVLLPLCGQQFECCAGVVVVRRTDHDAVFGGVNVSFEKTGQSVIVKQFLCLRVLDPLFRSTNRSDRERTEKDHGQHSRGDPVTFLEMRPGFRLSLQDGFPDFDRQANQNEGRGQPGHAARTRAVSNGKTRGNRFNIDCQQRGRGHNKRRQHGIESI